MVAQVRRVLIPNLGTYGHFIHRDDMKRRGTFRQFKFSPPPVQLPVDGTGNASVSCPMDDNDRYGICGPAMCQHMDNIWTYGQGKPGFTESVCDLPNLLAQYLKVSGGDNGTDEAMLVGPNGIWKTGLAGNPAMTIVDSLDIDITNIPLAQYAIDQFYGVCVAWSVPDEFISGFGTGTIWPNAMTPNPANGHYTPFADVGGSQSQQAKYRLAGSIWSTLTDISGSQNLTGFYRLWTWATWCWVGPKFVASVQPQSFVTFSTRQFNPATGLDSKGRHISTQAKIWQQVGGIQIPDSIIQTFPPINGPVNPPPVNPPPVNPPPVNPPPVNPPPSPTQSPLVMYNLPAIQTGQRVKLPPFVAKQNSNAGRYMLVEAAGKFGEEFQGETLDVIIEE